MIDANAKYRLIYTSVAFAKNTQFLRKLRDQYDIEIPFLDVEMLSEEMKSAFDTYLYIIEGPDANNIYSRLTRAYPQITFTHLGTIAGREILKMLENCAIEASSNANVGQHYRVLSGPYRNLIVRMTQRDDQIAQVEYPLFKETRTLDIPIANLVSVTPPPDTNFGFTNLLEQAQNMSQHNAIIIDGNNAMYRSMFGYSQLFTRLENRFVGGAFGFYFTLLKLKELYPEYAIHVVFDGYDVEKMTNNPEYKSTRISNTPKFKDAFRDNLDWSKRFIRAAGFSLYHFEDREADDIIGSLARRFEREGYAKVLVYSSDTDFMQLVSDTISIYTPKQSFRGHTQLVQVKDVLEKFGISEVRKTNWVRALGGDSTDDIPSVNIFNKLHNIPHTNIRAADYLPHINAAPTLDHLRTRLKGLEPFAQFFESGQFDRNYNLLTLNTSYLDHLDTLDDYANDFDYHACVKLLEEVSFYKELEMWERNSRILQGIW